MLVYTIKFFFFTIEVKNNQALIIRPLRSNNFHLLATLELMENFEGNT